MMKYEKYKDSGIEWIGEIPEKWDVKKIKHRCYVKGRVGWKGLKSSEFLTDGFSYLVTGTDFKNDTVDWDNCYHIDEERYNEDPYIQLQNEDLLITKDGTIGKLAVVTNLDKPACLNSGIFVVRSTKDDFSTRFLLWVLKSSTFTDFNGLTAYGSTIQHLYQNVFVEFAFAFPPVNTQVSIADYLQNKTAEIDQIIANKQKLITFYEEEKQAIINQAVTKGLDPNVNLKDSGVEWLGEIPEHWEVKKIKYIGKFINGYSFDSKDFIPSGIRVIKISNIQNMRIDWSDESFVDEELYEKYSAFRIFRDDLIFALTRPIISTGIKATIVDCDEKMLLNQRNSVLRTDKRNIDIKWLYYIILNPNFIQEFDSRIDKTGQQPNISSNDIGDIIIPVPSTEQQIEIIELIEKEFSRLDYIIEKFNKQIELLQEYRTTLISEVVTGKIKVPNTIEA